MDKRNFKLRIVLVSSLFVLLSFPGMASAQSYSYFKISTIYSGNTVDMSLDAGSRDRGDVYMHGYTRKVSDISKIPDTAQWQFIPVRDANKNWTGYYYIRNRRHQKYIHAGSRHDGNIHHNNWSGAPEYQWKLVDLDGDKGKRFHIIDRKHGLALMGSDRYDKQTRHYAPGDKSYAIWYITRVTDGGTGPREVVLGETFIKYIENDPVIDERNPEVIKISETKSNYTDRDIQLEFNATRKKIVTESYSLSSTVSEEVWTSFTTSAGIKAGPVELKISNTTGFRKVTSETKGTSATTSVEITTNYKDSAPVAPQQAIECGRTIKLVPAIAKFRIRAKRVYADNREEIVRYRGTKRYNRIIQGNSYCKPVPLS